MPIKYRNRFQKGQRRCVTLAFLILMFGGSVWAQDPAKVSALLPHAREMHVADSIVDAAKTFYEAADAIPHYLDAITLAKLATPKPWITISNTYYNIGWVLGELSLHQAAEGYCLQALEAWKQVPQDSLTTRDSANRVRFFNALATYASRQGKMDLAKTHILEAGKTAQELQNEYPDLLPFTLNNAASIFNNLGNIGFADSCARRSVEARRQIYKKAKKSDDEAANNFAYSLITLAEIFGERAEEGTKPLPPLGDSMVKYLALTKPLLPKLKPRLRYEIDKNYAIAYRRQGDFSKAKAAFETAVKNAVADTSYGRRERGMLLEAQGRCLLEMKDYDGALHAFQRSMMAFLPTFHDSLPSKNPEESIWADEPWLFILFNDKARAFAGQDRADLALECRRKAFAYVNHLREGFSTSGSKEFITKLVYNEFEPAIALAQREPGENCDLVFEFMERSKTNEILESMRQAAQFGDFGIPEKMLVQWRSLQAQISMSMSAGHDDVQQLIAQQQILKDSINRFPQVAAFTRQLDIASIGSVRNYIANSKKDPLFLEYFVGEKSIYILAIDANNAACFEAPHTKRFDRAVEAMIAAVSSDPGGSEPSAIFREYEIAAYTVFRYLFGPVIDGHFRSDIPRSLIIVPDGKLDLLPFEALLTARGGSFQTASYLVRDCEVRYAHSATTLLLQHKLRLPDSLVSPNSLLAISASPSGQGLAPLKYVHEEAAVAHQLIDGRHLRNDNYWRKIANKPPSEANITKLAKDYSLLHFACHAIIDKDNPMQSWIALDDGADHPDSLFAYEIMGLSLHARLAVLSACKSGDGRLQNGEGVMSLARAFFVAGCERVIMSLWNIDGKQTREIMEAFYGHLKNGRPAAQSLRMARLDYLKGAEDEKEILSHPYFWAAMVAVGDDGPYLPQGPTNWRPWLIWGSIFALVIALILRRQRSNRRKKAR